MRSLREYFVSILAKAVRSHPAPRRRSTRLWIEELEDRLAPAGLGVETAPADVPNNPARDDSGRPAEARNDPATPSRSVQQEQRTASGMLDGLLTLFEPDQTPAEQGEAATDAAEPFLDPQLLPASYLLSASTAAAQAIDITYQGRNTILMIGPAEALSIGLYYSGEADSGTERGQYADLHSLDGANLAFVATLLTGNSPSDLDSLFTSDANIAVGVGGAHSLVSSSFLLHEFESVVATEYAAEGDMRLEESTRWVELLIGLHERLEQHANEDSDQRLSFMPDGSDRGESVEVLDAVFAQWPALGAAPLPSDAVNVPPFGALVDRGEAALDACIQAFVLELARVLDTENSSSARALAVIPGLDLPAAERLEVPTPTVATPAWSVPEEDTSATPEDSSRERTHPL